MSEHEPCCSDFPSQESEDGEMKRRPSEELLSEAEPATEDGKGRSESLGLLFVSRQRCAHTFSSVFSSNKY